MVPELLSVAGVTAIILTIVTVIFQYAPGLRVKWAAVKSEFKMLIVLGAYIVVGAIVAFGGCVAFIAALIPSLLCSTAPTFLTYAVAVFFAVGAGQGVFNLLPELKDVTAAKDARA